MTIDGTSRDTRGSRRSTTEIRELILSAARDQFVANGFVATRTRDVADQAGVQERLLFTNFGSKLGLFNAALVEPLKGVVADFLAVKHSEELSVEARLGVLIGGLYDIAREHRSALRSVLGAGGGAEADGLRAELFAEIASALQQTVEKVSSYPHVDSRAAMIDLAGMVFGVALLDDMLIEPRSRRPSRARLLNEMTKMAAARLTGHGETSRTDGS
jgi:AcrR family transcriptional regulator